MKRGLLLLLVAAPALGAFEDLGHGARAPGLGGAFTALADDLYAVQYNAAGLAQLERPQASASYSRLHLGLSDGSDLNLSQLGYAQPLRRGRLGVLGGAWQRFSAAGLYEQSTLQLAYGKDLYAPVSGSRLMLGGSLKYLSHGFHRGPEASNAMRDLAATGQPDPVLSGDAGKGALDADVGVIYRLPRRFQLGFSGQQLLRPDVGFAQADRLPMRYRLGAAYRSLWLALVGELRLGSGPSGERDLVVAAERFFPTLDLGQFGLRASLGFGSAEWRQATLGASYRVNKVQLDYAFLMPFGSLRSTAGTHRMGMTFHFGAPTEEEKLSREMIEQSRRIRRADAEGFGYEYTDTLRPHDLSDARLESVRREVLRGRYRVAHNALQQVVAEMPPDASLSRLANRLGIVAYYYNSLETPQEAWERSLSSGIRTFMEGRDHESLLHVAYAATLKPFDPRLKNLLAKLEEGLGMKAEHLPVDHPRDLLQEFLHRAELAHSRRQFDQAVSWLQEALLLDARNATAYARMGSAEFMANDYPAAIRAWEKALSLEEDAKEQASLRHYLEVALARQEGRKPPPLPEELAPRAAPTLPPAAPPAAAPASPPAEPRIGGDPRDVLALYQKGAEHYARREYIQAKSMFLRILQIDPDNEQAKKALERLERTMSQEGGR
ncbi:MAG: hypothetical protein HY554_19555 [Elusimicrobia bacterium]|nr:hypothetical protein [Elusimicrobiota bacterium]